MPKDEGWKPASITQFNQLASLIVLVESARSRTYFDAVPTAYVQYDLFAGHTGFGNYLFADGHANALKPTGTCGPNNTASMWANYNQPQPCQSIMLTHLSAVEKRFQ